MKALAINGSPRPKGNTFIMIQKVFAELNKAGIETELFQIGGEKLSGCHACMACKKNQNQRCIIDDDVINDCITKMIEADIIILGSPVYFSNVTAEIKALIDRSGYVTRANGGLLKRKIGAAVIAVRRSGANHVFNSINDFFLINEMIVPGSNYWNLAIGREIGDVENDEEGMRTMEVLGQNIAWLAKKIL